MESAAVAFLILLTNEIVKIHWKMQQFHSTDQRKYWNWQQTEGFRIKKNYEEKSEDEYALPPYGTLENLLDWRRQPFSLFFK